MPWTGNIHFYAMKGKRKWQIEYVSMPWTGNIHFYISANRWMLQSAKCVNALNGQHPFLHGEVIGGYYVHNSCVNALNGQHPFLLWKGKAALNLPCLCQCPERATSISTLLLEKWLWERDSGCNFTCNSRNILKTTILQLNFGVSNQGTL